MSRTYALLAVLHSSPTTSRATRSPRSFRHLTKLVSGRLPALLTLLAAACLTAAAFAQNGPRTIDVGEIRAGMTGYGLSVFRGTQPERFDVEVIDVLHGFRPDQDLILVKTPHPLLNHVRAVGGMSGSPIYIDGRLAGAYAYGWQFGLDPVIGVTPIRSMLAEIDRPFRPGSFPGASPLPRARNRGARRRGARRSRPRASLGGSTYEGGETGGAFGPLRSRLAATPDMGLAGLHRASTPLMLGGFTAEIAALMRQELEPHGFLPMQGGATGQAPSSSLPQFVDGGAIGVQLISGDISATAIGTVTHVGPANRLVAFGHPMMNAGEVGLPTATARVLHVLASAARSFKIAEAIAPLGTLVHDRQAAIVVDTGLQPATIPVRLRITGLESPARTEWNMRVASHRQLSPVLVFGAIANAIKASSSDQTDVMFTARYTVTLAGHAPITLTDRGYMGAGPADARALTGLRLFDLMEIAYANPFEESRLLDLDIELDVRFGDEVRVIVDASTPTHAVDPGSTIPIRVRLHHYGEADTFETVNVHIPQRAAGQAIRIELKAGATVRRRQPQARHIDDLIARTLDRYPATSIVTSIQLGSRSLAFRGHVARSLPRSVLDSLRLTTGDSPGRPFRTEVRSPTDIGQVVVGSTTLTLQVRQTAEEFRR